MRLLQTQTVTPLGLVALANAAVTPRCVGIHRCIPPLSFRGAPPALPVHPQGSAHLQDALRCQPELCREDAPRGFAPSCSGASPSPRLCPWQAEDRTEGRKTWKAIGTPERCGDAGGRRGGGAAAALPLRHVALRFQREGDVSDYRANNSQQRSLNTSNYRWYSAGRARCENANTGRAERSVPGKAVGALELSPLKRDLISSCSPAGQGGRMSALCTALTFRTPWGTQITPLIPSPA